MRSTLISAAAVMLAGLGAVEAQTYTKCDSLDQTCPGNPALGTTIFFDFTKGNADGWTPADGTVVSYSETDGMQFTINEVSNAPTMSFGKYIQFGNVQAFIKASNGQGIVSSFIMLSDDLDEIDWEFLGGQTGNAQTNFFGKNDTSSYDREVDVPVSDITETFHNYTIDWSAESITWFVDGTSVRTLPYGDPKAKGGQTYPQTPMQVKMGNWVGCASQSCFTDLSCPTYYTCEWAKGYVGQDSGPYTMSVANVTIKDYSCGTTYTYGDNTGSYQSIQGIDSSCSGGDTTTTATSASNTSTSSSSASGSSSGSPSSVPTPPIALDVPGVAAPGSNSTASGGSSATGPGSGSSSGGKPSSPSSSSSTGTTVSGASTTSHFGFVEMAVVVLGLGLGFLVM